MHPFLDDVFEPDEVDVDARCAGCDARLLGPGVFCGSCRARLV
jgi:hypothetical protein